MRLEHAAAEREAEHFDLGARMLARRLVDEGLERLAGNEAVGAAFEERGREVAFEPDRDRQIAGVVAVAAADDAQHPQAGFALAARTKSRHPRTVACVPVHVAVRLVRAAAGPHARCARRASSRDRTSYN